MNKISGILPTSPRIESVDMTQERPVRAGAFNLGQPIAKPSVRPQSPQSGTVGGLSSEHFEVTLKNPSQKSEEKMIEDMAAEFFLKPTERKSVETQPSLNEAEPAPVVGRHISIEA